MLTENKTGVNCAYCAGHFCTGTNSLNGPENCPTRVCDEVIKDMMALYHDPELGEFARNSALVEANSFQRVPWSETPVPATTRLEEIIRLCLRMGYKKIGVAFCVGFSKEAEILIPILEKAGFEIVSVCCKAGAVPKEEIGVKDEEKVYPGRFEAMCNPISQAEILNRADCEFNIMMGLCVGHDALFLRHAKALTTVFAVKDRLLANNPLSALYLSGSSYRRILDPNLSEKLMASFRTAETIQKEHANERLPAKKIRRNRVIAASEQR